MTVFTSIVVAIGSFFIGVSLTQLIIAIKELIVLLRKSKKNLDVEMKAFRSKWCRKKDIKKEIRI